MLKRLFMIIKYIFENGPNVVFWIGVLLICINWYSNQGLPVLLPSIALAIFGIVLFVKKLFKDIKKEVLNSGAKTAIGKDVETTDSAIDDLKKAIPTNTALRLLYGYAQDYAKNWAPDGKLLKITYYIKLNESKVENRAQIFIYSAKRNEKLTTYFPKISDTITENSEVRPYSYDMSVKGLYQYPGWKDALKDAIEKLSSDIAKAEKISIQINTYDTGLSFNFTFELQTREWSRSIEYKK